MLASPHPVLSPSAVLQDTIKKYGVDPEADAALVQLLDTPSIRPVPATTVPAGAGAAVGVPGFIGGGVTSANLSKLVPFLVQRLSDVLLLVMRSFDDFLALVDDGAYSGGDLASLGVLFGNLSGKGR